MDRGPVKIHRYDPAWAMDFEKLHDELYDQIGKKVILIEHIGSTSVEGLGAKPIIDILITVPKIDIVETLIDTLQKLRYEYVNKDEDVLPFRRYFVKSEDGKHLVHLHIVPHGHEFHITHIAFRDFLRKHPDVRDEYHLLKTRLANKFRDNREGYQKGKSDFILRITNIAIEDSDLD